MTGDLDFALSKNLAYVNVSGCSALKSLDCYRCSLKELYVSGCIALENLDCSSNSLTNLDLSGCSELRELSCRNNKISSEIPLYLWGVDLYLDYRYDYYYENGETKYIDNNIGWWYPGEPGSGKHDWPD